MHELISKLCQDDTWNKWAALNSAENGKPAHQDESIALESAPGGYACASREIRKAGCIS